MKNNKREILIFYNPESESGRKTVAYAQSISNYVEAYSFEQSPYNSLTGWCKIVTALDMDPKDLLNKAHPYYQENIRGKEFDEEGWLNVLRTNPQLIKAPIAMRGKRAVLCINPQDVFRLAKEEREREREELVD